MTNTLVLYSFNNTDPSLSLSQSHQYKTQCVLLIRVSLSLNTFLCSHVSYWLWILGIIDSCNWLWR